MFINDEGVIDAEGKSDLYSTDEYDFVMAGMNSEPNWPSKEHFNLYCGKWCFKSGGKTTFNVVEKDLNLSLNDIELSSFGSEELFLSWVELNELEQIDTVACHVAPKGGLPLRWQPTEQEYRELCGIYFLPTGSTIALLPLSLREDNNFGNTKYIEQFRSAEACFTWLLAPMYRIESIPEDLIPKKETPKERYISLQTTALPTLVEFLGEY
jgi:hypothetical protein